MGNESLKLYLSSMACVCGPGSILGQPKTSWEQQKFWEQRKRWGRDGGEMGARWGRDGGV